MVWRTSAKALRWRVSASGAGWKPVQLEPYRGVVVPMVLDLRLSWMGVASDSLVCISRF